MNSSAAPDIYQALFQAAGEAILWQTPQGRILDCNAAACELYGYTRPEMLGLDVAALTPPDAPAALLADGTWPITDGAFVSSTGKRKDGSTFASEISTRLVTLGSEQFVVACVRDVAPHQRVQDHLRQAEWRYRMLVEQIPAVIYIDATDEVSSAIYMSPQAEKMLGYTAQEWTQDPELWIKLLHPDDRERVLAENIRTNQTGDPFTVEYRLRARDGRTVWVRDVAVLVRDEAGRPQYWQGVMLDITERKRAEEDLRAQKLLFEKLVAVARATSERPTLQDTLQNALNVAASLTGAEHGDLFLVDQAGAVIQGILTYGQVTPAQYRNIVRNIMNNGLAGWVARQRQAVLLDDATQDERWLTFPGLPAARSVLSVPIITGDSLVGILTLFHSQAGHFEPEHLRLMQAAVDQMALAVRNAQIFDAQRRTVDRQTALYQVLSAVSQQRDPDAMMRVAVDAIVKFAGWPHVSIAMLAETGDEWVIRAASGRLSLSPGTRFPVTQGVIGRVFRTGRTQLAPQVAADPDYALGHPAICSELAAPVQRGERLLGVLNLESDQPDAFGPDDVLLAESLADALALALENGRLFQATQTERSRLQALIEASRDGIILVGMDGRILVVNAPALQLLQMPGSAQAWIGRPIGEALLSLRSVAPNLVRQTLAEMRRIQKGDEPPGEGEYELPPRVVHWANLPVIAGATPLGRLLALHDVTDERAVERLREDMTHTMVHDLRNPLGTIYTALIFLQEAADTLLPEQQHALSIARSTVQKMLALVNGILDVNQLESGRMPVQRAPVQLSSLVAENLEAQSPLAREKGLRLESRVSPDLPPAWADAGLVGRVLQNLVGNAVKFTPPGGRVCVTVTLAKGEGTPVLQVEVNDDGPGISPEVQGRLFQKFAAGPQAGRGSGLGLAFCKLAVEAHGGRIWVKSPPGCGATFGFNLPVAPA